METLVEDLFLLAQLDRERPLQIERVDLADLVLRSVAGVGVSAPDRSVVADVDATVVVDGDEGRIRQVVDNLLVNAVIHTPADAPVGITLAGEDGWAVLTVHDEGPGIDAADAVRIFEPFFRADPSRSRSSGGAGLGLAIVAAIVGAHGGTVRAVAGHGATFEVRIPEHRPEAGNGHVGGEHREGG